jgi:hypothetical protein
MNSRVYLGMRLMMYSELKINGKGGVPTYFEVLHWHKSTEESNKTFTMVSASWKIRTENLPNPSQGKLFHYCLGRFIWLTVTQYRDYATELDDRGSVPGRDNDDIFFSSPQRPDQLWRTPSLISNGYRGSFPGNKAAGVWSWPLTSI